MKPRTKPESVTRIIQHGLPPDNAAGEQLLVRHRIVSGQPIHVGSLPLGIYIVKIAAGSQTFVQRIVKL